MLLGLVVPGWAVSGGELGTSGPSVPAGKGSGRLATAGVLGFGGVAGGSAGLSGSVGLSMSWWQCNMNAMHLCFGSQHGHSMAKVLPLKQTDWE